MSPRTPARFAARTPCGLGPGCPLPAGCLVGRSALGGGLGFASLAVAQGAPSGSAARPGGDMDKDPIAWRNVESMDDVRAFVAEYPDHRVALAWGQMLVDMEEFGDEYSLADFKEEADLHLLKGHV